MPGRVTNRNQVYLAGHRYFIKGDVASFLASQRPQKFITGDIVEESNPIVSSITWSDLRGGIGKDVGEFPQDINRSWTSTLHLRNKGHLVLPPLATELTGEPSSVAMAYDAVWGLLPGVNVYVTLTNAGNSALNNVYPVNSTAGSIGATVRLLNGRAVDIKSGMLNDSITLAIATFGDVDWTNDGSSWNRDNTDIEALCFHRGMLWGLGYLTGNLYFTANFADGFTQVSKAPWLASAHTAPKMIEGNGPDGERALYLAPHDGLYRYEPVTETIRHVLPLPYHIRGGRGCIEWRNAIYYSAGLAIYEFIPGTPNVVNLVGPDLDDGLANMTNGYITGLVATHEELIASVIVEDTVPRGLILGWNKQGWQIKWEGDLISGATDLKFPIPFVATAGGLNQYWLFWGHGAEIAAAADTAHLFKMEISTTITNPTQLGTHEYSSGEKTLETPWVTPPADQDWTALSLIVDSVHPTSSETVEVKYATDFSSVFTTVATKSVTGLTRYNLTDSDGEVGIPFRGFRLGLDLTRGATDTNSPDVRKASLIYRKNFSPLLGFQFTVDLNGPAEGRSAKEVLAQLREFFNEKNPQEFTFKDHDDADVTYYVTPVSLGGLEKTGQIESGVVQLTVVQTIPIGG